MGVPSEKVWNSVQCAIGDISYAQEHAEDPVLLGRLDAVLEELRRIEEGT